MNREFKTIDLDGPDCDDLLQALDDETISAILCVYITTDGQVRQFMRGVTGTMKLIAEPSLAAAQSLLRTVDEVPVDGKFREIQ
jgi:hypothetical protein